MFKCHVEAHSGGLGRVICQYIKVVGAFVELWWDKSLRVGFVTHSQGQRWMGRSTELLFG